VKLGRFSAILDAYGAEPERWPERERADALVLSRSSVAAARALAQARMLDAALKSAEAFDLEAEPVRFAHLHSRIMSNARTLGASWFVRWFGVDVTPRQLWPSVAGLALATLLGFAVGMTGLLQLDNPRDGDDTLLSAIDEPATVP
jgi:hypothetical protein